MAVALTPGAYLVRTTIGAPASFSAMARTRIDVDRDEFTILAYAGNGTTVGGGGFQFTVDPDGQLVIFAANPGFEDLLGGAGPAVAVGDWWDFGVTAIVDDVPDNIVLSFGPRGGPYDQLTVSYEGAYQIQSFYAGARPGPDGSDGAFRLHGSVCDFRLWARFDGNDAVLTPVEMLAEFDSDGAAVRALDLWGEWPMVDAATADDDTSGAARHMTAVLDSGTITTTDGPFDSNEVALAGHIDAASAMVGTLTVEKPLVGHIDAAFSMVGTIVNEVALAGHVDTAEALAGTLTVGKPLAGHVDAATSMVGTLTVGTDDTDPGACQTIPIPAPCRPVRAIVGHPDHQYVTCIDSDVEPERPDLALACD